MNINIKRTNYNYIILYYCKFLYCHLVFFLFLINFTDPKLFVKRIKTTF